MIVAFAHREQLRVELVRSLLTGADRNEALLGSTVAFVNGRLAELGGITRLGVLAVECILSALLTLTFSAANPFSPRTDALLRHLGTTALPVVADYVHLVRSLALVFVYELRFPPAEARSAR